jgi:hypothetical protein
MINPYKTTHREPLGIVIVTPLFIVIGPADIALEPAGIEYETVAVKLFNINGCVERMVVPATLPVTSNVPVEAFQVSLVVVTLGV